MLSATPSAVLSESAPCTCCGTPASFPIAEQCRRCFLGECDDVPGCRFDAANTCACGAPATATERRVQGIGLVLEYLRCEACEERRLRACEAVIAVERGISATQRLSDAAGELVATAAAREGRRLARESGDPMAYPRHMREAHAAWLSAQDKPATKGGHHARRHQSDRPASAGGVNDEGSGGAGLKRGSCRSRPSPMIPAPIPAPEAGPEPQGNETGSAALT